MTAATENDGAQPTRADVAVPVTSPEPEKTPKPGKLSSTALYTASGVALLAGNLVNELWASVPGALALLVAGLLLGLAALHRSGTETPAPAVPSARRTPVASLWAVLVLFVVVHVLLASGLCRRLQPVIDTYTFQRDATRLLLSGADPYGATQPNPFGPAAEKFFGPGMVVKGRVQVGLQYPPLTLLWLIPGYLMGDVRFSYILAVVLSAVLLFAAYPNLRAFWVASALLLNFVTVRVEFYCWTEPLVLLTVCATLFAAARCPRWLFLPLGLFLAAKQYDILALPFLGGLVAARAPFSWKAYARLVAASCAVAAATLLPFAVWNPRGLWHDLVLFHLAQPFRADSLSFAVFLPMLTKVGPLLLLAFLAWGLRTGARNVGAFAAGFGLALLLLFLTGKQAFANYYFLAGNLVLLYPALQPEIPLLSPRRASDSSAAA